MRYTRGRSIRGQNTESKTASECASIIKNGITARFILDCIPTDEWHHSDRAKINGLPTNFYNLDCVSNAWKYFKLKDYDSFYKEVALECPYDISSINEVKTLFTEWNNYLANKKTKNNYENIGKLAQIIDRRYKYSRGKYIPDGVYIYVGYVVSQSPTMITIQAELVNDEPLSLPKRIKGKTFEIFNDKSIKAYSLRKAKEQKQDEIRILAIKKSEEKREAERNKLLNSLKTDKGILKYVISKTFTNRNKEELDFYKNWTGKKWVALDKNGSINAIILMSENHYSIPFEKWREIAKKHLEKYGEVKTA